MRPASVWRNMPQRYRLEAGECTECGKVHFPPRRICDGCGNREFTTVTLPSRGQVVTNAVVRVPAPQFEDQSPYPVAIIELENGVRITAEVTDADPEEVEPGLPVRLEFRRIQADGASGVITYGHKVVPAEPD